MSPVCCVTYLPGLYRLIGTTEVVPCNKAHAASGMTEGMFCYKIAKNLYTSKLRAKSP